MAKDAKGHGSEKRGGGSYNPVTQGGKRMFGREPTAAEKGQLSQMTAAFAAFAGATNQGKGPGEAHTAAVAAAHGVQTSQLDKGAFRLQSHTHEIVSPGGEVAARMRLGKSNGLAVNPRGDKIARSGGTAIHDAVGMADYRAKEGHFPSSHIDTELHYLTGNSFPGHTVRRVKK